MPSRVRRPVGYGVPRRAVSGNSSRYDFSDVSDIRETLDQLDRRLGELRRQVAAMAEAQPGAARDPQLPQRLRSVTSPAPELAEPDVPPVAPGGPAPDAARALDEAPAELNSQIQQLMTFRDRLLAGARDLLRAYERQLYLLEQVAASGLPAAAERPSTEAVSSADTSPAGPPVLAETSTPGPAAASTGPTGFPGVAREQTRPVFYEGTVTLVVSGAHRVQTVQVLEDAVARARHVERVYVRRCHRGRAWLELTLSSGSELLGEFNRVLPFGFAVTSATATEIALSLEGQQ